MSTEPGPIARLNAAMDEHPNATYVRVEIIDLRAGLIEARAALLAELEPVVVVTHEDDDSWSVEIAAMPGHVGAAMTIVEAAVEAHDAAVAWLEAHDAALLAVLEAGVERLPGLVAAGDDGYLIYGVAISRAAVLDLIRKAKE